MELNELGEWYKKNKNWLKKKAHYFISTSAWGFENVEELISLTIEELLHNRGKLKVDTLKEYSFFVMRSCFYTVFVNKRQIRNTCYDEILDELYTCFEEDYDFNKDIIDNQKLDLIYSRVNNKNDLIVIDDILSGNFKKHRKKSISNNQYYHSLQKLRGLTQYKKVEVKKPKPYKSIAKILDGKIVKLYPNYESIKKDGYSTSRVNQICKGRLKTKIYRKFEWKYITE